jgi:hypothetical protein
MLKGFKQRVAAEGDGLTDKDAIGKIRKSRQTRTQNESAKFKKRVLASGLVAAKVFKREVTTVILCSVRYFLAYRDQGISSSPTR